MAVILYIDSREDYLKKRLEDICIVKQLELGDISLFIDDTQHLLIERKSITDLRASIIDGRYKDQKGRMLDAKRESGIKIAYIIEGFIDFSDENVEQKIITSSIINTMIRDEIPLFFTSSVEKTCELVRCIYERVAKDPQKYTVRGVEHHQAPKKSRAGNDQILRDILCQIPGISLKTANMLVEKYDCFADFYANFKADADDLRVNNRRVSKTVISNIEKYFYKN
jgi:ERCC4-type nuclease